VSFLRAARRDDLWIGEMKGVVVAGVRVLLVSLEDGVRAYEDRCAHKGVALSEGRLEGTRLVCAAHAWEYDVAAGRGLNPARACLRALPVAIEGDDLLVDVAAASNASSPAAARADARGSDDVGPVLQAGPLGSAVVGAIRALNADARVIDRGAYLRVLCPRLCVVTRAAIEARTGAAFRLPGDLELVMSSFKGRFAVSEDEARWELSAPPAPSPTAERA
jgi:nitrite reductase/ring-hydroxylating ferredoxin subunit